MNPIRKIKSDGGFVSIFRNIGFIGDSLSSGEHESWSKENGTGWHDYFEYSWGQYIGRMCGLNAINLSKGGLTAKSFLEDYSVNVKDFKDPKYHAECYVIALGCNDLSHMKEIYDGFGSFDDVDLTNPDNNKNTFVGWYCKIIQKLKQVEPKCRIFIVSLPKENFNSERKAMANQMAKLFNLLTKKFEFVYHVNLWKYSPDYTCGKRIRKTYFIAGHMSAVGYKFTADMISTYMDYIIRHNVDDFRQIGFVGKGIHNDNFKW